MADIDAIKKAVDASRAKWGAKPPPPADDPSLAAVPHAYDTPPPPRVPLGIAKTKEAAATPEITEAAKQAAIDERAQNLVADEHMTSEAAHVRAAQELDMLRAMPEDAGANRSRAAIATAATPPTSTAGAIRQAVAPQVYDYSATPTREAADTKWHDDLVKNYTAITGGDISGWLGGVLHPEPVPASDEVPTSGTWLATIGGGLDDIGNGLNGGKWLTEAGRAQVQDGVRAVWKGIGDYAEDPAVRKLLEVPLFTVAGAGVERAIETGKMHPDSDFIDVRKPEQPGLVGVASRAAIDYLPLETGALALTQTPGVSLPYGDAYRVGQWVRDARPSEQFDTYAPLFRHGDADAEVYPDAAATLAELSPENIPDRDVAGARSPQFWRDAVKHNPDAAQDPGLAMLAASVARGDDDDTIAKEAAGTPYKALRLLDPSFGPSITAVAKLAERREQVQHLTGDASTDAVAKLLAGAMMTPTTQDGKPVLVERRGAQLMRLAGGIAQGVYDADLAFADAPGLGLLVRGAAAVTGAAGADELTQWIQEARVPTRAGLDHMLRTGTYDDALRWLGLHEYHAFSQEGDPDGGAGFLARVVTDLEHGERLGPGYKDIYTRAGGDPTSGVGAALGLMDLGLDFLNPADEFTFHALGQVPATAARATKGYRLAPEGAEWAMARAAAFGAPGKDSIEAVHGALMGAMQQAHDTGNVAALEHLTPKVVDDVLRLVANPDDVRTAVVASAKAIEARRIDLMQKMLDRGATPEREALRQTPGYVARAGEYQDLVKAGTLTPQQAQIGLLLDEVRAFNLADEGKVPSAEAYFGSVGREVGGTPPTVPNPHAFYQGDPANAPTFYSGLRRAVEGIKQDRFSADQLRGMLAKTPGVKVDEIEWTRLDDFLREHPKPTKTEVLGWLDENAVVVEEKRLRDLTPDEMRAAPDPYAAATYGRQTQYSNYQLPGGTNYREVLFRMPMEDAGQKWQLSYTDGQKFGAPFDSEAEARAELADAFGGRPDIKVVPIGERAQRVDYASPHFGDEGRNLLAHTRLSDRVGPNGEKILHVEEVQSDWHQAGREKGYELPAGTVVIFDKSGREVHTVGSGREAEAWIEKQPGGFDAFDYGQPSPGERAPRAPFSKTWHELVMKRILREAAEGGYDGVSWTTGVQQVKRYEDATRQAVDEVRWVRHPADEAVSTAAQRTDDARQAFFAATGRVPPDADEIIRANENLERARAEQAAIDDHARRAAISIARKGDIQIIGMKRGEPVYRETMPPEKVADVLGKGMASKIAESAEPSGVLKGADLTIGGEGMKGFYDKILPEWLGKYVKKWGGRVGETEIETTGAASPTTTLDVAIRRARDGGDPSSAEALEWLHGQPVDDVRWRHMADEWGDGQAESARLWFNEAAADIKSTNGREPVHYLPLTPKMRDALLHEGQPLFQRTAGTVRGSIEPHTIGYLERFFQGADLDTLLHEDGHLLRFMLGDDAVNAMFGHFDHTIVNGRPVLTRAGEEQAAEAIRWWMRTRIQPDGRLRGILDKLSTSLGDAWVTARNTLGVGSGNPAALPSDVAAYLDATFNPAARMKRAAIQVLTHETPRTIPSVPLSADPARAVVEDTVARAGRTREALRIDTAPAHVKAALGINADVTEIDPLELYKRAVAYAGTELYRKKGVIAGWGGDEPVVALTRRTIVPKSRVDRVLHDVGTRVRMAFGGTLPDVDKAGNLVLSPGQRAGLQGLVNEAINSPLGNVLPDEVRAFDVHDPASQMSAEGYNALNGVLTDIHAGAGARSNYLAEQVASAPLLTAIIRSARDMTAEAGTDRAAQRHVDQFFRNFVHEYDAAKYMSPAAREAILETMRSMGHTGEEILEDARQIVRDANAGRSVVARLLTGNRRMSARELMGKLVFGSTTPAVHPGTVDRLLELRSWFAGEGKSVREGGVPELSMDGLLSRAAPGQMPRLDEIETVFHTNPIRGASFGMGATADETEAIRILRDAEANRAARGVGWVDVLADPAAVDLLTDALGRVQHGIEVRHRMFAEQVDDLLLCAAGSTEKDVLIELPPAVRPRFYQAFWSGDWNEMFSIPTVKGHSVVGEAFNQQAAVLAMLARLRARKKLADLGQRLLDIGVADVDHALNLSTEGESYGATFGANGPDGFNAKRERVLAHINRITTFGEAEVPRIEEVVDPVTGDVQRVVVARHGSAEAFNLDDPMEREAYTLAHRYLAQLGWQFGKSTFGDVAVTLPDGGEFYLPKFVHDEIMATLDRTAKVGVAYADAQRSAAGRSFSEMSRAVARGEAVKGSYLGLAAAPSEEGRITPLQEQEIAAQARRRSAQAAGMVAGAGIGGVAFGPAGAVLGGALGRNVVPLAIEVGGKSANVVGKVAGATVGAALGSVKTVVDTIKTVFPFTTALGRVGMTAGLVLVNPAFFVGNAFGALFQTYMRSGIPGVTGTIKVLLPFIGNSATAGRMMAEMGGAWGERIARILPEARPIITARGEIWTTDMLLEATRSRGLDSSYVKSESSKALYDEMRKMSGHWTDRLMDRPLETVTGPLAAWQNLIMEGATAIDNANRVGVFLNELKLGKSADEAAKIARDAAFDYGNLTDFERQTAREVILFYSYMRQSLNLFWWTAVNHPERVTAMLRLSHGLRYKVDQPDVMLDDSMDNRLLLAFRQARENDMAKQGVATVSPPVPLDMIPLWVDFMGAFADESQQARGKLAARLTPWIQLPIVAFTNIEPYSASDVNTYNSVPNVVVEAGRMATGGLLDEVLGLVSVQNKDPSSDATPGQDRWQATNGVGWFALHQLFQMPPFGRSGDTLTMLDRWAPFGGLGPVTTAIQSAEAAGRGAGTDRFIRDILRPGVAMVPILGANVRPDLPMLAPMPQEGDLAVPRVGLTPGEEAAQLAGFKAVQPNDVDVEENAAYDAERRRAEATMKQQRTGEAQRYNRP